MKLCYHLGDKLASLIKQRNCKNESYRKDEEDFWLTQKSMAKLFNYDNNNKQE